MPRRKYIFNCTATCTALPATAKYKLKKTQQLLSILDKKK